MSHRAIILLLVWSVVGLVSGIAQAQSLRDWQKLADRMVDQDIAAAGVANARVIRAMRDTPRHEFVPIKERSRAYLDMALPIGSQQTISSPFIVAYMTEQLDPQPTDRVLEIGTGSGYQAAVLSPLVADVYTIEIVEALGRRASRTLKQLGYKNVHTKIGDGYQGWPEAAPFDKIIVTCSPEKVPQPLVDQLAEGGRLVVPVGERYQQMLYLFRKENGKLKSEALLSTLFVPMTGEAEAERAVQPDPTQPTLVNGSFEDGVEEDKKPASWHYQRRLEYEIDADDAADGKRFVTFRNDEPGLDSFALQGFAIDGRKISQLRLAFSVRGRDVQYGPQRNRSPIIVVTFYDDRRAIIGEESIGQLSGTFDWQGAVQTIRVPLAAREAIFRIGLLDGTGELSFDGLELSASR